jgi:sirohydrochlorin ferrochelatase
VLVGCSHGTRSPAGRRTIAQLRLAVAALRPGLDVVAAHVDVQKPELSAVVAKLSAAQRPSVVVPLLLSTGYHVRHDVRRAVDASGGWARATGALGPDEVLLDVLADRLAAAGAGSGHAVVVAAAGSLDPRAVADVDSVVAALAQRRGTPVVAGYSSAQSPTVAEAVASLRAEHPGTPVAVASYLLAPGVFSARLEAAGADVVAGPLGVDPRVAVLALRRYDEALADVGA